MLLRLLSYAVIKCYNWDESYCTLRPVWYVLNKNFLTPKNVVFGLVGPMTYSSTNIVKFLSLLLLPPLKHQPEFSNPSIRTQIPALRLKSHLKVQISAAWLKSLHPVPNPSFETKIPASTLSPQPQGQNLSFDTQNPASRLKSQLQGSNFSLKAQILASRLNSPHSGSNLYCKE